MVASGGLASVDVAQACPSICGVGGAYYVRH